MPFQPSTSPKYSISMNRVPVLGKKQPKTLTITVSMLFLLPKVATIDPIRNQARLPVVLQFPSVLESLSIRRPRMIYEYEKE